MLELAERFWRRVACGAPESCWEWRGYRKPTGYGYWKPTKRGRNWQAHRLAYALTHGTEAANEVCHTCDNRACCNPAHLRDGTHLENMRESVARGRQVRGVRSPVAKLDDAKVRAIRAEYVTGASAASIGRKYGVTHPAVLAVVRRETWAHVR